MRGEGETTAHKFEKITESFYKEPELTAGIVRGPSSSWPGQWPGVSAPSPCHPGRGYGQSPLEWGWAVPPPEPEQAAPYSESPGGQ